jgi:hypothetical protein
VARVNIGKHLIISDEVHAAFSAECAKVGVRMTDAGDSIIKDFLTNLAKVDDATKADALKELAARRVRPKRVPTTMDDVRAVATAEVTKILEGGDSNVAPQEANPEGQAKSQ